MFKIKHAYLLVLGAIVLIAGCDISEPSKEDNKEPIIPVTTEVVTKEEAENYIVSASENGTIQIKLNNTLAQRLNIGDVIASEPSTAIPKGILRKITNIQDGNDNKVIQTSEASVTDAIQYCDLRDSINVKSSDIDSFWLENGVEIASQVNGKQAIGTEFSLNLNLVLFDKDGSNETDYDQIKIDGNLIFCADIGIRLNIDDFILNQFEYAISKSQVLNLQASIGDGIDIFNYKKTIATLYTSYYILMIGPVPVVFNPRIDIILEVNVDGIVTVTYGYHLEETTRNGARYVNGTWSNIDEKSKSINVISPEIEGAICASVSIGTRNSVKIYGVTGPYVQASCFINAIAELKEDICGAKIEADVKAGSSVALGFFMEIFSHTFFDFNTEWNIYLVTISSDIFEITNHCGTITINPEPNIINAPWTLLGPNNFSQSDNGDIAQNNILAGEYTVIWREIAGWNTPDPETKQLNAGTSLEFTGYYFQGDPVLPPDNVHCSTSSSSEISVCWNKSANPRVTNYRIYRNNNLIETVTSAISCYTDNTLYCNTEYCYQVTTVDNIGNESEKSSPPSCCTTDPCQIGSIIITAQNWNGVAQPGAEVKRYSSSWVYIDSKTTDSYGRVRWDNIPSACYNLEVYYLGTNPFDNIAEFWGGVLNVCVETGQTGSATIRRHQPYSSTVVFKNNSTGNTIEPGSNVALGTTVRAEVTVINNSSSSKNVKELLWMDRDRAGTIDYQSEAGPSAVSGNGGTRVYSYTFTPSSTQLGNYYYAVKTTTDVNSNSVYVKTDSWAWTQAFTVVEPTGSLEVTAQNWNGVAQPGAEVKRYSSSWVYIDSKTTDSYGRVRWDNIPSACYNLEVYYLGTNPFDNIAEFWGGVLNVCVETGQTGSATIRRHQPYSSTVVFKNNSTGNTIEPGSNVALGTTVRAEVTVINNSSSSKNVKELLWMDRDRAGTIDYQSEAGPSAVSGNGGTRVYSYTFTPSSTQLGNYYYAVKTTTDVNSNSVYVKTDSWAWTQAFTVVEPTGSLEVTAQNWNGVAQPGAEVKRYSSSWVYIDSKTTNSYGRATWSAIPATCYNLEIYYLGTNPFDNIAEFWGGVLNVCVETGQTESETIRRHQPFASNVVFKNNSTGATISPGSSVLRGTTIRVEVTVINNSSSSKNVKELLWMDRDRAGTIDYQSEAGPSAVSGNGGTRVYSYTFTPSSTQLGNYYYAVKTTTDVNSNSVYVKTDSWAWTQAFTVVEPTGSLEVTAQNWNGVAQPGAEVKRYSSSWVYIDSKTTNSYGRATWSAIPATCYNLEIYYLGTNPFDNIAEFWGGVLNVCVETGQTESETIRRHQPFASNVVFKNNSTGATISPGSSVLRGTTIRVEVTVINNSSSSKYVRELLWLDRDRASSRDYESEAGPSSVSGNGGTRVYSYTFTPSSTQLGNYYYAVKTTTDVNSNSVYVKTDSWAWTTAFTIY